MSSYLITLKPTGKFFFGGEMTFQVGKDKDSDFNERFSSYIIESNLFPQQTSLLGMLRFLILKNSGEAVFKDNKIVDKDKAAERIGRCSFSTDASHQRKDYGKIRSISACFLMKGSEFVEKSALCLEYSFNFDTADLAWVNGKQVAIPSSDYDPKKEKKNNLDVYFLKDLRMGIEKDYEGKKRGNDEEEKALYKQINYRFKGGHNDLKFAFYSDVDPELDLTQYDGQTVSLGADSSIFVINIKRCEEPQQSPSKGKEVILCSPSYLEDKDMESVAFAVTQTISFRCLETTVETESYNRLHKKVRRSKKMNLYDSGSRFFFKTQEDREKFINALNSYKEFVQIGYNRYK